MIYSHAKVKDILFANIAIRFKSFNVSNSISKKYDIAVSLRLEELKKSRLGLSYLDRDKSIFMEKWPMSGSGLPKEKTNQNQKTRKSLNIGEEMVP